MNPHDKSMTVLVAEAFLAAGYLAALACIAVLPLALFTFTIRFVWRLAS